jgi:predicted Ser/Thr protein kinase
MILLGDSFLAVGRPGAFQIATHANGMPTPIDAIRGRDGTVWIATDQGLYRFASPFRIERWDIRDGLTDTPWSIARSAGSIYAGLYRRIVALSADRARWNTVATFKEGSLVAGLLNAEHGGLIAAIKDGGVVQLSATGQLVARTEKERPSGGMRLARTPDGAIWVGQKQFGRLTPNGNILKFEDHPLQTQPSRTVLAIKYEQRTRKLWACYNGGLVVRDEQGTWKEFTTRDGLLGNGCWTLEPLSNGDLWYSYFGAVGLALVRTLPSGGLSVRQYGLETGIPEPGGITLDTDQRGWLWRGGGIGLYVADQTQAEAGTWLPLDQSDGFPEGGMNSGSVFVDQDDSLWWGADNDLAHYIPPDDLVVPKFKPQVFVSAFSWGDQPPRLAEAVGDIPHGSKVVAHIGSLQFDRRNALRLRYRLLPSQTSWRETKDLDVALGSLSSGAHTFEVQGRVFTGPWSATVSQPFTVLRPVWLGRPFLAAYLIAIFSLSAGGYLLHRRRIAEASLLPDLGDWRAAALLMDPDEVIGSILQGRFEVRERLSRGDFADVREGWDRERSQRCAIKIFRSDASDVNDKAWIEHRFEQEVIALERVHHPNVVRIYAHGTTDTGLPYLVMEFIDGVNLRNVLKGGALPPNRVARILRQLASALDGIHAHGICHRDVKPDNVIVRNEGSAEEEVVLIDFSTAIVKDVDRTLYTRSRAVGTGIYMAPEQALGHAQPASDIYSLAKVTIEMLTGHSLAELLPDVTVDLSDRLPDVLAKLPIRFSDASISMLAAGLAFDPRLRPNAAGAFAEPIVSDLASGAFQKR